MEFFKLYFIIDGYSPRIFALSNLTKKDIENPLCYEGKHSKVLEIENSILAETYREYTNYWPTFTLPVSFRYLHCVRIQ